VTAAAGSGRDRLAVCTIVRGRRANLRNLLVGLARQDHPPDVVAIAVMGGPDPRPAADGLHLPVRWADARSGATRLPLAAARNAARTAAGDVADLVFLDVDVIPSATLVADYRHRLRRRPAVWSGQVDYLPPGAAADGWAEADLTRAATPPPPPPPPPRDERLPRPELFWSLSFGLPAPLFDRLGGFDEAFVGYGAEDTDFGLRAAAAGFELWRTPAARGWHQHHDSATPPVQHLTDIVANSRTFRERWGRWPMQGWLADLADAGLVEWEPHGSRLEVTAAPARPAIPAGVG
jgi:N-acetylglucosaminyl-diphospho-decaprenol L-rhamnosyltransferase